MRAPNRIGGHQLEDTPKQSVYTYTPKESKIMTYREDFHNVVRGGSDRINGGVAEDTKKVDSVCLQDPFLDGLVLALLIDDDPLFRILGWVMHVHLQRERGKGHVM